MANNPYVNKVQLADGTTLIDISDTTAAAADVAQGKYFYDASGAKVQGTATGGGGSGGVIIEDTTDTAGGVVRTITAVEISGTKQITANGTGIDVTSYESVDVAVPSSGADCPTFTITFDQGGEITGFTCDKTYAECLDYANNDILAAIVGTGEMGTLMAASAVDVGSTIVYAIAGMDVPILYINYASDGSITWQMQPIPTRDSNDLIVSGDTVTAPTGYYPMAASSSVSSGTAGTPTATKGTVSNHSVTVTPSVTNTTGYITGSTKTGTAVTVTASELASGNKEIVSNGTNIDVVGYSTVSVAVPSGSSKALYTYSGLASRTANSYGATNAKVTVAKAGTYDISYVAIRGSSSGTMGTNLHIGDTEKGNQQTWNNGTYGQYVTYSNQSISANTDVTIYATSGNASRTVYCGQLIVQEV